MIDENYLKILNLADSLDAVLDLYALTFSETLTDESGLNTFRVKGRGPYQNPIHYEIRYNIENERLGHTDIVPISEIAKQRLTPETVERVRKELGLK